MFGWLASRIAAWRVRVGQRHGLAVIDGRTLADVGLSRAAVNAALGGNAGLLTRQPFD